MSGPAIGQQTEIEGVIRDQIDTIRVDDFATAFTYASRAIKRLFGDPGRFGSMVREGLSDGVAPADVTFIELEERAAR